jgi:hypothetical protein
VFVERAEKTEFPGFGFLRQAKTAPCGDEHGSRREETEPGGLKEGDWEYTGPMTGAKMEIRAEHGVAKESEWLNAGPMPSANMEILPACRSTDDNSCFRA